MSKGRMHPHNSNNSYRLWTKVSKVVTNKNLPLIIRKVLRAAIFLITSGKQMSNTGVALL